MPHELDEVLAFPVAHRGLHNPSRGIIENSRTAFAAAISGDFAIECDLQLSADGVPVVFHDPTLDRTTGQSGNVRELSAGQLTQIALKNSSQDDTIMSLAQLLDLVQAQVPLLIELKSQKDGRNELLANAVTQLLANYKGPVALISFDPYMLATLKTAGCKRPRGILVDKVPSKLNFSAWQRFALKTLLHYPISHFDFIDAGKEALCLPAVRFFRFLGFPVASWTIRSQGEADMALKHCDQITFEGFIPRSGG